MKSYPVTLRSALLTFERRFPDDLTILLPAGVGDVYWTMCKLLPSIRQREAQGQMVRVCLPADEQQRAGALLEMLHVNYSYLPGLATPWVWTRDTGDMPIPEKGWFTCHANAYLETGRPLADWHPQLPIEYPQIDIGGVVDDYDQPFLLCFPSSRIYMQKRNVPSEAWTMGVYDMERDLDCTVRFVAAGKDVEYLEEICGDDADTWHIDGTDHIIDQSLAAVIAAMRNPNCMGMYGVAGGPTILAVHEKIPTVMFYPGWLHDMTGMWERPDAIVDNQFLEDVYLVAETGHLSRFFGEHNK